MKIQIPAMLTASLFATTASAADYVYTRIDYPGMRSTEIRGVNDRGDAVGFAQDDLGNLPVSFVYRWESGTFVDMPAASSDSATHLAAINDAGVTVGSVLALDSAVMSAFIRDSDGTYRLLFHPEATNNTHARGISNDGLVTGMRDVGGRLSAAFVYDPVTDAYTNIAPSHYTVANGINSRADIVGSALFPESNAACPGMHGMFGWRRALNGSVTFFQVNGQQTEARGINDVGLIAGNVGDETGTRRGFVIELSGSSPCEAVTTPASNLLQFPGYDETRPLGITDAGVVVGIVKNQSETIRHGFVAIPH
jgi:uncharacterized membrane protein